VKTAGIVIGPPVRLTWIGPEFVMLLDALPGMTVGGMRPIGKPADQEISQYSEEIPLIYRQIIEADGKKPRSGPLSPVGRVKSGVNVYLEADGTNLLEKI
jgi:hypothetical protein